MPAKNPFKNQFFSALTSEPLPDRRGWGALVSSPYSILLLSILAFGFVSVPVATGQSFYPNTSRSYPTVSVTPDVVIKQGNSTSFDCQSSSASCITNSTYARIVTGTNPLLSEATYNFPLNITNQLSNTTWRIKLVESGAASITNAVRLSNVTIYFHNGSANGITQEIKVIDGNVNLNGTFPTLWNLTASSTRFISMKVTVNALPGQSVLRAELLIDVYNSQPTNKFSQRLKYTINFVIN